MKSKFIGLLLCVGLVLAIPSTAWAQSTIIQGHLTDADGHALIGANVIAKELNIGSSTNIEGYYSFNVPTRHIGTTITLVTAYVGYSSQERSVTLINGTMTENFALQFDVLNLDEVVVTGVAVATPKKKLAFTVESVSDALLNTTSVNRLAGKVAGVTVVSGSGEPGAGISVRLRGQTSIQAQPAPLYIIDGVIVNSDNFNFDNLDIDAIEVVKGHQATGLFGARAANGLVMILTKGSSWQLPNYSQYNSTANTEEYVPIEENNFELVRANPLSTFSIDTDGASYSNIRRYLHDGQLPPAGAVRIEEMVNYFNYDYPNPTNEHPFSVITELGDAPWNPDHKLLHIGIQGRKLDMAERAPVNLVFLMDVSGSMGSPDKLPLLKSSFELLVAQLDENDRVAIVVYAGAAGVVLPSTSGDNKNAILGSLRELNAGGSTAGGAGIQLAYKIAKENFIKGGNNRIILATDGDFNVGTSSTSSLIELVEEKREEGTFLSVLGFGTGNLKDSRMEQIADNGNGSYYYIDSIHEAKKVMVNELSGTLYTIAKDVKLQLEFNPAQVSAYRLIGYENRALASEDFNNDQKDAGELGAGHTVTAVYEIIPAGGNLSGQDIDVDSLKYQLQVPFDYNGEWLTVKLRYKNPEEDTSIKLEHALIPSQTPELSQDFRFISAVAGFGMMLRNSVYKGNVNASMILDWAQEGLGRDTNGYRKGFIQMVEQYQIIKESQANLLPEEDDDSAGE